MYIVHLKLDFQYSIQVFELYFILYPQDMHSGYFHLKFKNALQNILLQNLYIEPLLKPQFS